MRVCVEVKAHTSYSLGPRPSVNATTTYTHNLGYDYDDAHTDKHTYN
jgi:hypothetical protein